jgi:hypothetical protein
MKRNLMIIVLLAGLLVAGHLSVTSASKNGSKNLARAEGSGLIIPQGIDAEEISQADIERSQIGFAISPVPVNRGAGRTRFLIGLGSYLVNATGGCNDCHTNPPYAPGGDPFRGQPEQINTANYLAGGVMFGPFTSRNITPNPDRGNLPAGLTLGEFIETMRTGVDTKNRHPQISPLLQVMPWPVYGKMSDRDLQAMYYYLSAIPHAERAPSSQTSEP